MKTGQQLGVAVVSIINGGFVQTAVTGARIGGDIFKPERFDHIQHEVRAGVDWSQCPSVIDRTFRALRPRLLCVCRRVGSGQCRCARGGELKELPAIHRILF